MTKHADKIAALRADEEGKNIQFEPLFSSEGWTDTDNSGWDFSKNRYREKPFEPEVGKAYMFSDEDEDGVWIVGKLEYIDVERVFMYRTNINGAIWKLCRPLTEDEIGK